MKRLLLLLPLMACTSTEPAQEPSDFSFSLSYKQPSSSASCGGLWGGCQENREACEVVTPENEAYDQWHRETLNMMMYASGCQLCRHAGAYKDMEFPEGYGPDAEQQADGAPATSSPPAPGG